MTTKIADTATSIRRYIQGMRVGDKLPGEHELSREFRVSRPTISAAMAVLISEGRVRTKMGWGGGRFVANYGTGVEHREVDAGTKTPFSDGRTPQHYVVTLIDGEPVACTCRDFVYRSVGTEGYTCKHMDREADR